MDHRSDPKERLHSIKQIQDLSSKRKNSAALLVGDFNTSPNKQAFQLLNSLWIDAWAQLYPDKPGYTIPSTKPKRRIDGQFIIAGSDDLVPFQAKVIRTEASDHLPLLISYRISKN